VPQKDWGSQPVRGMISSLTLPVGGCFQPCIVMYFGTRTLKGIVCMYRYGDLKLPSMSSWSSSPRRAAPPPRLTEVPRLYNAITQCLNFELLRIRTLNAPQTQICILMKRRVPCTNHLFVPTYDRSIDSVPDRTLFPEMIS
jgi:hypothetical protein